MKFRNIVSGMVLVALFGGLLAFLFIRSLRERGSEITATTDSSTRTEAKPTPPIPLLPYGNPSNAAYKDRNNFILSHESFILSYNDQRGTLNWAAWRTSKKDLGPKRPRALFQTDPELNEKFVRIEYYDYSGGGYDRGHIVPSADRFADQRQNEETFLLTNIVPQTGSLNQYPWNELEQYARSVAYSGGSTYTFAGVYGEQDRLKGKIAVPTNCWKVIVVFPQGNNGILKADTRVIAVDMPNVNGIDNMHWQDYLTTVRDIEEKTGLDLFNSLPRDIQDAIELRKDSGK